eukprot:gb/GECG01000348.1/.p1 GENE.gb/GECG01000348.1/~~gb/GECG01000348.1/.p1  ORF type:complete len:1049 (+),score=105.63 gb/GECG01000348.1/:1-3147(+)
MKFIIREVFLWLLGEGEWEDAALTADAYAETSSLDVSSGDSRRMTATISETADTGEDDDYNDMVSRLLKESIQEGKEHREGPGTGPDYSGRAFLEQFIALGKQYSTLKSYTRSRRHAHSTKEHGRLAIKGEQGLLLETEGTELGTQNTPETTEDVEGNIQAYAAQTGREWTSIYRSVILEGLDKMILRKYEKHILDLEAEVLEQNSITLSYAWAQVEPYREQFSTIGRFLEDLGSHHYPGGQILDAMYSQMEKVTMAQRECLQILARPLRRTIIQQISSWVTHGEIIDPTYEFFIKERLDARHILCAQNRKVNAVPLPGEVRAFEWSHRFYIDWQSVPQCIIEDDLTLRIFFMGKATRLLRQEREQQSGSVDSMDVQTSCAEDYSSPFTRILQFFQAQPTHDPLAFECAFQRMGALIQNRILTVLKKNGGLQKHFAAMRNYMLLGRGELYRAFIEQVEPLLDKLKPASSTSGYSESTDSQSALLRSTTLVPTIEEEIREGPWAASALLSSANQDECFANVDVVVLVQSFGLLFGQAGASMETTNADVPKQFSRDFKASLKMILYGNDNGIEQPGDENKQGGALRSHGLCLAAADEKCDSRPNGVTWFKDTVKLNKGFRMHSTLGLAGRCSSQEINNASVGSANIWIIIHTDTRGQYLLPRFEGVGDFGCPSIVAALTFTPLFIERRVVTLKCACDVFNYGSNTGKGNNREYITSANCRLRAETKGDSADEVDWAISLHTQFSFSQSPSTDGQIQFSLSPLHASTTNVESINLNWRGDMETYLHTGPAATGAYVGLGAQVPRHGIACMAKWQFTSSHPYFEKHGSLVVRYKVPWPQSLVFGSRLNHVYEELFRYLFSIRRCLCRLNYWWKRLLPVSRNASVNSGRISQDFWLLRYRITFTIEMLYYYMQIDVIDSAYSKLLQTIEEATNFESLMRAHNAFIHSVIQKSFLGNRMVANSITKILSIAFEFQELIPYLFSENGYYSQSSDFEDKVNDLQRRFEHECKFLFEMSSALSPAVSDTDVDNTRAFAALLTRLDFNNWFSLRKTAS